MPTSKSQSARVTRADVARRAGISQTTVAYVLNNTPGVKIREETRAKVVQAAKELGYTPSFSARSMKRGRTELIGILTPAPTSQFHPYYSQMLYGIHEAAADTDFHFLTLTSDRPAKYRRCLSQNYLDGALVIQSDENWTAIEDVLSHKLPTVSLNVLHDLPAPQITVDYESAMAEAVATLLDQGSRKLLFVHGSWDNQPIRRYLAAFRGLSLRHGAQAERFDDLGIERYRLAPDQIATLLNEGWDGLIVDGYELAREISLQTHFHDQGASLAMVALSETPNPSPLGERVTILQAQPAQVGRLGWEALRRQLGGQEATSTRQPVSFINLNQIQS